MDFYKGSNGLLITASGACSNGVEHPSAFDDGTDLHVLFTGTNVSSQEQIARATCAAHAAADVTDPASWSLTATAVIPIVAGSGSKHADFVRSPGIYPESSGSTDEMSAQNANWAGNGFTLEVLFWLTTAPTAGQKYYLASRGNKGGGATWEMYLELNGTKLDLVTKMTETDGTTNTITVTSTDDASTLTQQFILASVMWDASTPKWWAQLDYGAGPTTDTASDATMTDLDDPCFCHFNLFNSTHDAMDNQATGYSIHAVQYRDVYVDSATVTGHFSVLGDDKDLTTDGDTHLLYNFDEAGGVVVRDSTTNGYDATMIGDLHWVSRSGVSGVAPTSTPANETRIMVNEFEPTHVAKIVYVCSPDDSTYYFMPAFKGVDAASAEKFFYNPWATPIMTVNTASDPIPANPCLVKVSTTYYLVYDVRVNTTGTPRKIVYRTSTSFLSGWSSQSDSLLPNEDYPDVFSCHSPGLYWSTNQETWYLTYTALASSTGDPFIMVASTRSENPTGWEREDAASLSGDTDTVDEDGCRGPSSLIGGIGSTSNRIYLFYTGVDDEETPTSGLAVAYGSTAASVRAAFTGLFDFKPASGTEEVLVAHGTELLSANLATGTFSLLSDRLEGTTEGGSYAFDYDWNFFQHGNQVYMGNGRQNTRNTDYDRPIMFYNGSDLCRLGIPTPTATPTAADSGVAGLPSGDYTYRYTLVRQDASGNVLMESGPSPVSASVTVASKKVTVGSLPNAATISGYGAQHTTHIYIYRTLDSGAYWYYVGNVAKGTTSFTDNIADTDLGAKAPDVNTIPFPAGKYFEIYQNCLWVAGDPDYPNRVYFSENNIHYLHNALWYRDLPGNVDQQTVTGMKTIGGALYIFTKDSVHRVTGISRDDWRRVTALADVGCIAPRSLVDYQDTVMFLSRHGIYGFDGTQRVEVTSRVRSRFRDMSESRLDGATACMRAGEYLLAWDYSNMGYNNRVLVFDTSFPLVVEDTGYYPAIMIPYRESGGKDEILFAHSTKGHLCRGFTGTVDETPETPSGTGVPFHLRTGSLTDRKPEMSRRWRRIHFDVKKPGGTLRFMTILDNGTEAWSSSFDQGTDGATFPLVFPFTLLSSIREVLVSDLPTILRGKSLAVDVQYVPGSSGLELYAIVVYYIPSKARWR